MKKNEACLADWRELESLAWRCLGLLAFFVHDTSPGEGSSRPPVCMNALRGDGFKFYVRDGAPPNNLPKSLLTFYSMTGNPASALSASRMER